MTKKRTVLATILVIAGFGAAVVLLFTTPPRTSPVPSAQDGYWPGFSLFERSSLSGRVVDERGDPIVDASVEAHSVLGRRVELEEESTTDGDGVFSFDSIPLGFVAIVATADSKARTVELVDLHRGGLTEVVVMLEPGASIMGQVVDDGEAPVVSARVCARSHHVGPMPELEAHCSTTDERGEFAVHYLPEGLLAVGVDGEGITSMVRPDVIAPVEALVLRVNRRGTLRGTVRLPNGNIADDAEVTIAGSGLWPPRVVAVEGDGTYLIEDLPAGVYEIEARSEGLVSMRELGVEVRSGRPVTVDLDLEQGASLQGRVLDGRTGDPIEDARIVVADDLLSSTPVVSWSGPDGFFVVAGLSPGEHRLSVWSDGRVPVVGRTCLVPSEVEVTLAPEAVVSGRVVDERGFPVEGASVEPDLANPMSPLLVSARPPVAPPVAGRTMSFGGSGGELGVYPGLEEIDFDVLPLEEGEGRGTAPATDRSALDLTLISTATVTPSSAAIATINSRTKGSWPVVTKGSGEFRLGGLPAGSVLLLASHPVMATGRSKALTLTPGSHLEGIEIVLTRGVELRGRVVDSRDFPIDGALVNLHGASSTGQGRLTFSSEDGMFAFDGVSEDATLSVSHSSYAPVTVIVDIEVADGAAPVVEIALEEASRTVRGRILDNRDFPLSGAEVVVRSVTSGSSLSRHTLSAEDGTFSVDGMAGGIVVVTARAHGMSEGSTSAGPEVREVTLWLERAGALMVEVVDPHTGEAIEGCSASLLGATGRRLQQACDGGTLSFTNVPSGQSTIWVSAPGRSAQEQAVMIAPGVELTDPEAFLRVELAAATRLTGQVFDAEGEPVVGARVSLAPLPRTYAARVRGDWVESGVQGRFELEGLEVDTAAIVYADHPSLGSAQVDVGPSWPGEEPEVELWLEANERSSGRRHFGLAIELRSRGGVVVVHQVAAGCRAELAGLRRDDQLISISGREVSTVGEANRRFPGPRGTALVMTIRRGDEDMVLLIERELVFR